MSSSPTVIAMFHTCKWVICLSYAYTLFPKCQHITVYLKSYRSALMRFPLSSLAFSRLFPWQKSEIFQKFQLCSDTVLLEFCLKASCCLQRQCHGAGDMHDTEVTSTCCSCKELEFGSKHQQWAFITALNFSFRNPTPSSYLSKHT